MGWVGERTRKRSQGIVLGRKIEFGTREWLGLTRYFAVNGEVGSGGGGVKRTD